MKKYLCLLFLIFSFDLFAQSYSIPEAKRPKEIDIEKAKAAAEKDETAESEGKFRDTIKYGLPSEINELLDIHELPHVEQLNILPGSYVNLEYSLPNGKTVTFLNDDENYLGSELEGEVVCVGIVVNMNFILICTYELDGANPELILYKKR